MWPYIADKFILSQASICKTSFIANDVPERIPSNTSIVLHLFFTLLVLKLYFYSE
jgi:hypothetical protein